LLATSIFRLSSRMLPRSPRSTLFPYTTLFRSIRITESSHGTWIGRSWVSTASASRGSRVRASSSSKQIGSSETLALVITSTSGRSEEHTSELQSRENLVCRLLLEKKKKRQTRI